MPRDEPTFSPTDEGLPGDIPFFSAEVEHRSMQLQDILISPNEEDDNLHTNRPAWPLQEAEARLMKHYVTAIAPGVFVSPLPLICMLC
jgi:hypothetical protein